MAALDEYGIWHRLYPVNFQDLKTSQRFGRWDVIEFAWRLPEMGKDRRAESKRIVQESVQIVGKLKPNERQRYLDKAVVLGERAEYKAGRSLALIRPTNPKFRYQQRSKDEIERVKKGYDDIRRSPDLFGTTDIVPREPSPFEFYYEYTDADGKHDKRCHDWETERTFLKWRDLYGEEPALREMQRVFGEEYPQRGMALAMGTHGQRNWQWMIIGVLRLDVSSQTSFL